LQSPFRPKKGNSFFYHFTRTIFFFFVVFTGRCPVLYSAALAGQKVARYVAQSFTPFVVPADRQEIGKGALFNFHL